MGLRKQREFQKIWLISKPDPKKVEGFMKAGNISSLTAKVLVNRGVNQDEVGEFLNPSLSRLYDPFLLKDMDKAVNRIKCALDKKEKILVYGDYDVDGITSTACLVSFLKGLGADVEYFIPDRFQEGYGLSINVLKDLVLKYSLIVTVDCGVTSVDEVDFINEHNVDVIITDHHTCKEVIPDAVAVIAPSRPDCTYPYTHLAGVGVAFKLIQALSYDLGLGDKCFECLDLIALGTIADVVDINKENRIIVSEGLKRMQVTSSIGIKALLKVISSDRPVEINSRTVSFLLAPRINAAGRMGDAEMAVELLLTDSPNRAMEIARELNSLNIKRQEIESEIFNQACDLIDRDPSYENDKVLVVASRDWHQGVIGIVASKLCEKYSKSVIMIALDEDVGKGSGRSFADFHLFDALSSCESLLTRYGGHEAAAGLAVAEDKIQEFRKAINAYADDMVEDYKLIPKVYIDCQIEPADITLSNYYELEQLAPFGIGNFQPVFSCSGLEIKEIRQVGADNKHLKITFNKRNYQLDAVAFNMGHRFDSIKDDKTLNVAFTIERNAWNGRETVQLRIIDIKRSIWIVLEETFKSSLNFVVPYYRTQKKTSRNSVRNQMTTDKQINLEGLDNPVVLINDLEAAKEMFRYMYGLMNKGYWCKYYINHQLFWFSSEETDNGKTFTVCANPIPEKVNRLKGDKYFLFGPWEDQTYKSLILDNLFDSQLEDLTSDS